MGCKTGSELTQQSFSVLQGTFSTLVGVGSVAGIDEATGGGGEDALVAREKVTQTPPAQRAPISCGSALSRPSLVRVGEATHSQRPAAGLQAFSLVSKTASSDRAIPIATALPQQSTKCRATAQSPSTAQPQPISTEGRDSGHSSARSWRRRSGMLPVRGTTLRAPDGLPPGEQVTQTMAMAASLSATMTALGKTSLNTEPTYQIGKCPARLLKSVDSVDFDDQLRIRDVG